MKLRIEPITLILVSILLSWGWSEATKEDRVVCQVQEEIKGKTVLVPKYCDEI